MLESKEVALFLNLEHVGRSLDVQKPTVIESTDKGAIKFANHFSSKICEILNSNPLSFVIATSNFEGKLKIPHVISLNPRLDFCKVLCTFFKSQPSPAIEKSAVVSDTAIIEENVYIGHNTVIADRVRIGAGTVILHNTVVSSDCQIGRNCLIRSNTVIGEKGFGFERDVDDVPIEFPHFGAVVIGDNVEIGALTTIVRGTLQDTLIGNNAKIDDHVHIAHNCVISENAMIIACAEVSGSVKVGKNSWIGPNASVIESLSIGDGSLVGIGSNVIKDVPENSIVAGNPARELLKS